MRRETSASRPLDAGAHSALSTLTTFPCFHVLCHSVGMVTLQCVPIVEHPHRRATTAAHSVDTDFARMSITTAVDGGSKQIEHGLHRFAVASKQLVLQARRGEPIAQQIMYGFVGRTVGLGWVVNARLHF